MRGEKGEGVSAKELRDKLESGIWPYEGKDTILRALDLLAAVEGSSDEIVRELRDEADLCRNETATDIADLLDEAASCIVAMGSQFKANGAALVAMKAAKEKAEAERDEATSYAKNLAEGLHRKHYAEVTQWKPLDDLLGLLTQIDNMTARLVRALDLQEKP